MNAILQKILRYLILTDNGHKILKGILILIIGFILLPTIAFSPVAGFGIIPAYAGQIPSKCFWLSM